MQVGLLDIDLCGPSIPKILGLEKSTVYQCPEGYIILPCNFTSPLLYNLCFLFVVFKMGSSLHKSRTNPCCHVYWIPSG